MSKVIYTPRGRAREYSPLALNVYLGCSHRCKYCYAASMYGECAYFTKPSARKGIAEAVARQLRQEPIREQVLMSFVGDCYCESADDGACVTEILDILSENKVPTAILTKGGKRCLRDLEAFKRFGEHIQVGETFTFANDGDSAEWECGASLPAERIETLRILHESGIATFASFEPVIDPEQSLALMESILPFCDVYKVGKINNYHGIDAGIDWTDFLDQAVALLRSAGKRFYIKHDLRLAAPSVRLFGQEVLLDEYCVR